MKLLCLIITLTILLSCKKDDISTILVSEGDTTYTISSVDSTFIHPLYGCEDISPSDGYKDLEIDVNGDGLNDFKLVVQHEYKRDAAPCERYTAKVSIHGIDGNLIANLSKNEEKVNKGKNWTSSEYIKLGDCKTIGLRLVNNSKSYYGWMNINTTTDIEAKIVSYAINLTANKKIKAGQLE